MKRPHGILQRFNACCALVAAPSLFMLASADDAPNAPADFGGKGLTSVVEHYTVDGGGGSSSGGAFTIEGTIAQPDADPLQPSSGGIFAITGGFWPAATVALEDRPDLIFTDGFEL